MKQNENNKLSNSISEGEEDGDSVHQFLNQKSEKNYLQKKRKNKTDIVFNSNENKFEDSFIPNLEDLNDFLKNCTIKEIKLEDIQKEIDELSNKKVFDPDVFIKENYENKEKEKERLIKNFSIEELGFNIDIDENNNNKEEKLKESYKNNEENIINKILSEKDLNKQKNEIHNLLISIKKMNIEDIKKSIRDKDNKKLNIIFDLDSTCIFGLPINPRDILNLKQSHPTKKMKIIKFKFRENILFCALLIRNGLSEFFEYTKSFCNFYINTLGYEKYGLEIKNVLEKQFNIKFCGFKGRKNEMDKSKFLSSLNLDAKNSVIFDDKPNFWINDNANVIISKIFTDRDFNIYKSGKNNLENNIHAFLSDYSPFYYYKSSKENWLNQSLRYDSLCPFNNFQERNCFSGEYLDSNKYQFIYMKEIIKIIYYLIFNSNMCISDALKIIRYDIFYNCCFDLRFYKKESNDILKDIIENCGGIIYDTNNINNIKDMNYYLVCSFDGISEMKEKIKDVKKGKTNPKVVTDEYILNSFYFMTNLENKINNP